MLTLTIRTMRNRPVRVPLKRIRRLSKGAGINPSVAVTGACESPS